MRVGLISTTINIPKVLKIYRILGPDVAFYVAADEKTSLEAYELCASIPNCELYSPDRQRDFGYACSELLGWSNDSRRNIALLEAVKAGVDVVVSVDDDMVGLGLDFFERFEIMLSEPYSGLQLGAPGEWCDAGKFTFNSAPQRGLPLGVAAINDFSFAHDVQIGAMQGIILGTPDTDAGTTMARHPFVHSATDLLRNGFVINPQAKSVFNSQITAFRRELAPCFAQFYKWQGRNTDIFASLVIRRVMRETNLRTYFGPPFGFHNRSPRDPRLDLAAERWGVEHVMEFERWLDGYVYMSDDKTNIERTRRIYEGMAESILPRENVEAALAFLDDMEKVL